MKITKLPSILIFSALLFMSSSAHAIPGVALIECLSAICETNISLD